MTTAAIEIGQRIRRARRAAGLSQAGVCRQVPGLHVPDLSDYERGRVEPRVDRLRAIAEAVGVADWRELLPE